MRAGSEFRWMPMGECAHRVSGELGCPMGSGAIVWAKPDEYWVDGLF